jgi:hypothetical protein
MTTFQLTSYMNHPCAHARTTQENAHVIFHVPLSGQTIQRETLCHHHSYAAALVWHRCNWPFVRGDVRYQPRDSGSMYERGRMPKAYYKQQVSFLNGAIWQLPDGPAQQARDNAMSLELSGKPFIRSTNLYGDPVTLLSVYG